MPGTRGKKATSSTGDEVQRAPTLTDEAGPPPNIKAKDTIPLSDYRDKAGSLQKIHAAHSSAETSGLGDSLQRIHTLSSTETSGVGETLPSPSTAQSLENISTRSKASVAVRSATSFDAPERSPATRRHKPSPKLAMHEKQPRGGRRHDAGGDDGRATRGRRPREGREGQTERHLGTDADHEHFDGQPTDFDDLFYRHAQEVRDKYSEGGPPPRRSRGQISVNDFEVALYMNPNDVSNNYLGVRGENQSAWMKWSQDRRASFKRRLDSIEQRQKEMERTRVSTPVKKARKESMMFVSPELEDDVLYIDEPDSVMNPNPNWVPEEKPKPKPRIIPQESKEGKLTVTQLNVLIAFWEHDIFVKCRYLGIFMSVCALIACVVSITSPFWSIYEEAGVFIHKGLWYNCSSILKSNESCNHYRRGEDCGIWDHRYVTWSLTRQKNGHLLPHNPYWQSAVIGLLVFSVTFGFLATILTVCGLCASGLPRKLYYYHSAGEIYFICALATAGALVVYPVALKMDTEMETSQLHYGYMIGWAATLFYAIAWFCMTLDDMVRKSVIGCCCVGRKHSTVV